MRTNIQTTDKDWFERWFDSPFYYILYKDRNKEEAEYFIDRLLEQLQPPTESRILDLACGKGRYSRYLAQKGFAEVTGLDLSERHILEARQYEQENLHFYKHDMRLPFRSNYFDYTFNFFTSFGYFKTERDDLAALKSIALGLRPGGILILDFFNSNYVREQLTGSETKQIDDIQFNIFKKVKYNRVFKSIDFTVAGKAYHFEESVRLFSLADFERLFELAGLKIVHTFGDYQLQAFNPRTSPRLILQAARI